MEGDRWGDVPLKRTETKGLHVGPIRKVVWLSRGPYTTMKELCGQPARDWLVSREDDLVTEV